MNARPDSRSTVEALSSGCFRTCARLITSIERGEPNLAPLLQELYVNGRSNRVIGITGPPGAGKSSLVNQLIAHLRRLDKKVAILAVDPSSPFSGGAVLGDRLRMMQHSTDSGVFIRSMASRGQLGGLTKAASDALIALDAMPWDFIVVETVGVGQNELDIMQLADIVVLVQTPMSGDDVQAAKAGINEIGDIHVVNKCDHGEADRTVRFLQDMIALDRHLHPEKIWTPPVVKTQSLSGTGFDELIDRIDRFFAVMAPDTTEMRQRRRRRIAHQTKEILRDLLERRFHTASDERIESGIDSIMRRERDPYSLATALLSTQPPP